MGDWTSLLNSLNGAALTAFGREVIYTPQSGAAVTIRAIVETAHESEETAPGTYALAFVRLGDLPGARAERGDAVEIDGAVFKVFKVEADGQGGAVLSLRLA
jgi:hypothetical protein